MKLATTRRNEANDSITNNLNDGYLRIYDGAQPADPQTALAGNTLLAELRFNATAFGASANGVATANAITSEDSALASGTPTFARLFESDGSTVYADATVGTSGTDIILGSATIAVGNEVSVTSMTHTQAEGS